MPRKCSITGCRVNYGKRKKVDDDDDSPCSVFGFPKDAGRLKKWLHRIPQENLNSDNITDYMGVCERHFDSRYIVRSYTFCKSDGSLFSAPRHVPVLSDDAIPTIFANTPS
jgi:THAP domain